MPSLIFFPLKKFELTPLFCKKYIIFMKSNKEMIHLLLEFCQIGLHQLDSFINNPRTYFNCQTNTSLNRSINIVIKVITQSESLKF